MEFSLSGVQNKVEKYFQNTNNKEETAAYALRCVCYAVKKATENALKAHPGLPIVFSGGVASNTLLRENLAQLDAIFAQPQYSTDNAMGVAILTYRALEG
jgi:N6-L-threonylcarbamoyladenine synthase